MDMFIYMIQMMVCHYCDKRFPSRRFRMCCDSCTVRRIKAR